MSKIVGFAKRILFIAVLVTPTAAYPQQSDAPPPAEIERSVLAARSVIKSGRFDVTRTLLKSSAGTVATSRIITWIDLDHNLISEDVRHDGWRTVLALTPSWQTSFNGREVDWRDECKDHWPVVTMQS